MPVDRRSLLAAIATAALAPARKARAISRDALHGFNLIETPEAPFGSEAAARSMRQVAALGANCVALIPFLWQSSASSAEIVLGDALPPDRLRAGIAQARAAGLSVVIKPHIWVPHGWAGMVAPRGEADWRRWFSDYRAAILPLARIAAEDGAAAFVVGTEVRGTVGRSEWRDLIATVRSVFPRRLTYVAHGADEAEKIAFWPDLDAVGVSLYPALGAARDKGAWHRAMAGELARVRAVALRANRPVWIGEIGLRSAADATKKPWESAEERTAAAAPELQAHVIGAWLHELTAIAPEALLVWRWFSDPDAGGRADTDFTVQGKPAADVLRAYWLRNDTRAR